MCCFIEKILSSRDSAKRHKRGKMCSYLLKEHPYPAVGWPQMSPWPALAAGSCSPGVLLTGTRSLGAFSSRNRFWLCCWGKTTSFCSGIYRCAQCLQALRQPPACSVFFSAWGYMELEALSFNLLILKDLCLFKWDGFRFDPFLCKPIKHFNPSNVKSCRCATAGSTEQRKNGAGLKW